MIILWVEEKGKYLKIRQCLHWVNAMKKGPLAKSTFLMAAEIYRRAK